MRFLLLTCALVVLGGCSFRVSEQNFIRPQPDATPSTTPLSVMGRPGLIENRQQIRTADGAQLQLVSLTQPEARLTVLYFGPNMFKLSVDGAHIAQRLLALGVNLVLVDYRGSGGSSGTPTLELLERDALQVYDYVRDSLAVPPDRLVVHGLSLGSFMAAQVALDRPLAGLVLEGSGTTVTEWAQMGVPWYAKPIVRLDIDPAIAQKGTLAAVMRGEAPLLILAGKRDEQAPWKMSQKLFDAANAAYKDLVVEAKAGHVDILDGAEAIAAYRRLLVHISEQSPP